MSEARLDLRRDRLFPRQSSTSPTITPTSTQTSASPSPTSAKLFGLSPSTTHTIIIAIVVLVVLALGYWAWKQCFQSSPPILSGREQNIDPAPFWIPAATGHATNDSIQPIRRDMGPSDDWRVRQQRENRDFSNQMHERQQREQQDREQQRAANDWAQQSAERAARLDAENAKIIPDKKGYVA